MNKHTNTSELTAAEMRALAALDEAPHGRLHFQLYPAADVTVRALERRGLIVCGPDLYFRRALGGV